MIFSATHIHDGEKFLPAGSCIHLDPDGTITQISDTVPADMPVIHKEGILCPGFINVHCHLELSHMKGRIPEKTSLIPFLQHVTFHRNDFSEEDKKKARRAAYLQLLQNGIVALGDIANATDTMDVRQDADIRFHTFVETIGFAEEQAAGRLAYARGILDDFAAQTGMVQPHHQTLTAHAPYSVSRTLFELIDQADPDSLLSIHNQETPAEDQYYRAKEGAVRDLLKGFGIDDQAFIPSGKSSLRTYASWLSASQRLILVHNTFSSKEDILFAEARFREVHWCLCPNANLYIEGTLPDIILLRQYAHNICLGTDSLASNHRLCIFSEMQTLKGYFPQLEWEDLIAWGTGNGARALGLQDELGFLKTGTRPGLVCINDRNDNPSFEVIVSAGKRSQG